jgi:hypothetical protein
MYISKNGLTFFIKLERDYGMQAPWVEHAGHGVVNHRDRGL